MRCLFISEHWTSGSGALVRSHADLFAQSKCELFGVTVQKTGRSARTDDSPGVCSEKTRAVGAEEFEIDAVAKKSAPLKSMIQMMRDPSLAYLMPDDDTSHRWHRLIEKVEPDLIWAEHLRPATFVNQTTSDIPMVYSHHDWSWRIKRLRTRSSLKNALKFWLRKKHEIDLVRQVDLTVSASYSEAEQIQDFGGKAVYLPITYSPVDLSRAGCYEVKPRIVHLGAMAATANRVGLQRFLEETWPVLQKELSELPELWIVGSLSGASRSLLENLEEAGAICTGYVEDLASVLRPYDVHIVPWEYNTGVRTRVPLILNYMQALVAVEAGVACFPELYHGENCMLASDLRDMAHKVIGLLASHNTRRETAERGRETFLAHFTREAVQPKFDSLLDKFR